MNAKKDHLIPKKRLKEIIQILEKIDMSPNQIQEIIDRNTNGLNSINEALTHTSANSHHNHERLEFLGDAVLRLAASEFIEKYFPEMLVGDRSALRSQLVSDESLTKIGASLKIEKILITGPKAIYDKSALSTLQAEATEALIGAIYEALNNMNSIHQWLTPYWKDESLKILSDPYKKNVKSALQEWCQSQEIHLPNYEVKEISKQHGDPERFLCEVYIEENLISEGLGGSRKEAEKEAAKSALKQLNSITTKYN